MRHQLLIAALGLAGCARQIQSADVSQPSASPAAESRLEPPMAVPQVSDGVGSRHESNLRKVKLAELGSATLGGKQFWADVLFFRDWHIQRHSVDGHCRLLDGKDKRHAAGSFAACAEKLESIKRQRQLPPMQGKVVIVLHGLGRSRASTLGMARYLTRNGECLTFPMGYPSTMGDIAQHARSLASVIEHLDGVDEIDLVAHSLGNLVIRHYFADASDPSTGGRPDERIKRIVMIGPPNNGARMAEIFGRNAVFESIVGDSGKSLASGWADLEKRLATPPCEFGIIAGGRGDGKGYNPLLPGDDDLIVAVEETKLPGARESIVLPAVHAFMLDDPAVQAATLRFLQSGTFAEPPSNRPRPAGK